MNDAFDLQRAIAGEPIEMVSGTQLEFVAYRPTAKASKQLIVQDGDDILTYHANGRYCYPIINLHYDIRMKSLLKQIDWAKLPIDTLLITQSGYSRYFNGFRDGKVTIYTEGRTSKSCSNYPITEYDPSKVRIAPDQPWTVLQGGDCPLPDGIEFEYMIPDDPGRIITSTEIASAYVWTNYSIYAYRITGKVLYGYSLC
jgi:hypothetical protein